MDGQSPPQNHKVKQDPSMFFSLSNLLSICRVQGLHEAQGQEPLLSVTEQATAELSLEMTFSLTYSFLCPSLNRRPYYCQAGEDLEQAIV